MLHGRLPLMKYIKMYIRLSMSSLGPGFIRCKALFDEKKGVPLNLNFLDSDFDEDSPKSIRHMVFYPYFVMIF